MKIFLDTEFTGLHQNTSLISLALVAENGQEFYAECTDYDKSQINPWLEEHVLAKLTIQTEGITMHNATTICKGNKALIGEVLKHWLMPFDVIEIWADVLAYDWVLFCELFGGAMNIPDNIFYAPFDLATLFRVKNMIEPISKYQKDISRFEFVGADKSKQHHALEDARVELLCYKKIMG
jgi:3' exoribonuclease, RNase T-like